MRRRYEILALIDHRTDLQGLHGDDNGNQNHQADNREHQTFLHVCNAPLPDSILFFKAQSRTLSNIEHTGEKTFSIWDEMISNNLKKKNIFFLSN